MRSPQTTGTVTLVGAGPGDPELLTLKAVKAIATATVLLVDDLVNEEVLQHAQPGARIVFVGKRGGCSSTPQAFIEKLMVSEALRGETVVRLKGGDPLVFGRGGEELDALHCQFTEEAERKCRKLCKGQVAFSPDLQNASRVIKVFTLLLKKSKVGKSAQGLLQDPLKKLICPQKYTPSL